MSARYKHRRKSGLNPYGQAYGEPIAHGDQRPTQWAVSMRQFRRARRWYDGLGPAPGQPGCLVPREIVFATDGELKALVLQFRRDHAAQLGEVAA